MATLSRVREHLLLILWLGVMCTLASFSFISIQYQSQMLQSGVLLSLLLLCYGLSKHLHSPRAQLWLRLSVIFIVTFLTFRYMNWRVNESLPMQYGLVSMVCGLLLLLAEGYGLINMLFGFFINSQPYHRQPIPLPDDRSLWPHVDVYIPTYNEDPSIIRPTVIAASQMDYPADKLHVYILDDGGTVQKCQDKDPNKAQQARTRAAELKAIAERFGAGYLTREKNLHAKSGNINSALAHTDGELLLVLDCDHIPTEDFLQNTVGLFLADPKLFVVQTPHNFISPDPLERNLDTFSQSPAENELFYDVMQPGLDAWGCSFFCGSAAILRRSVIDELGGLSGQTITEDAETTIDAMGRGYSTAYLNKAMVSGLQPETYSGFVVQRVRWGQGMLQIFLLKNPWLQPKLKFTQRLLYTNFAFYWGFASSRLILLLAPPAFLLGYINLCDATAVELISYAGPVFIASLLATQFFYGRVRWPFMSQLYEVIQSVYVTKGLLEVFRNPRSPTFKVTPKGETLSSNFVSSLSWPFYLLLAVNFAAVVWGIHRYIEEPFGQGAVAFVLFWAILDLGLILGALGVMMERRQLRVEPRVPHEESVKIYAEDNLVLHGTSVDVSAHGAAISLSEKMARKAGLMYGKTVSLHFNKSNITLQAVIENTRLRANQQWQMGVAYKLDTISDERRAIHLAFHSSEALQQHNRQRHKGRSIIHAILIIFSFAWRHGLAHLRFGLRAFMTSDKKT